MSNDYYNHSSAPPALTRGSSATMRAEFDALTAGFDKLPLVAQVWGNAANYAASGGSADAWTAAVAGAYLTSYTDGLTVRIKFAQANATTTPTLNLNSLGAKTIVKEGDLALAAGDIPVNGILVLTYNSSLGGGTGRWQVAQTSIASAASAAAAAASASAAAGSASAASTSATQAAANVTRVKTIRNLIIQGGLS